MTASLAASLLLRLFLFSSLTVLFSKSFSYESLGETTVMGSAAIHTCGAWTHHEHVWSLQRIPASLCLRSASQELKGASSAARGG